jgi:hypothetical protein
VERYHRNKDSSSPVNPKKRIGILRINEASSLILKPLKDGFRIAIGPKPGAVEPDGGQEMQRRCFRAAIGNANFIRLS